MVEELGGQYTTARRSYGGFSIELLILYCLGKQLTSKQASRRDFEANKQASKQRASKSGNQASQGVFCLLACLSASLCIMNVSARALPVRIASFSL
jgi:hypothetical protein